MSERLEDAVQQLADEEIRSLRAEIERLRLTDADRKALEWAILTLANSSGARVGVAMDNVIAAQQLRKLLERLGPTGSE